MAAQKAKGPLLHRVAVVSGGSRGIGRAIAVALAEAGASVAVVSRSEPDLIASVDSITAAGGRAIPIVADVTNRHDVERMRDEVERQFGSPDLLVNNAGSLKAVGPLWEIDPDRWWIDVETNLRSAALCAWAVLPGMVERGSGTIINMTSISATSRSGYDSAYSAAKAGLIRFTSALAAETAGRGIRVFAVHPGTVRTDLTRQLAESPAGRGHFAFLNQLRPDEWADPSRVAHVCVALAAGRGDRLSGYFIDVVDTPTKLFWRAVGQGGLAWRDLYAFGLCRSLARSTTTPQP